MPVVVEVAGDRPHAGFERLGGLVAGRGAEVEESCAGPRSSSGTIDCEPMSCSRPGASPEIRR